MLAGVSALVIPKQRLGLVHRPWLLIWIMVPTGILGLLHVAVRVLGLGPPATTIMIGLDALYIIAGGSFLAWLIIHMYRNGKREQALSATRSSTTTTAGGERPSASQLEAEVRGIVRTGNKIRAVKRVREVTGWGLKEAKTYVDALEHSEGR